MRKRFEIQYELGATPIEEVPIPTKSRDEMPAVLRALQYVYSTPELNEKVFEILERKITKGINSRTGRPGAMLWEILVFGVVRQARDMDFDHLHHVVNYDSLVRKILGISDFGDNLKKYSLQAVKDNVALLDEETLNEINTLIVQAGHQLKKNEKLNVKVDTYVVETNVHFPTDLNLLWDGGRKCLDLIRDICEDAPIDTGWRKQRDWRKRLKKAFHQAAKRTVGAGRNTVAGLNAALHYLSLAEELSRKIKETRTQLELASVQSNEKRQKYFKLHLFEYFLDTHIHLVRLRLVGNRIISHDQKMFSLFEPHTRWIKKGKAGDRVELGLPVAVATDQYSFILAHHVMQDEQDVDIAVPFVESLVKRYLIDSLSFDKGFWSPINFKKLKAMVDNVIMPKKGKRNKQEMEREHDDMFQKLRRHHAAVESDINGLEHHALNRCPDKGIERFKNYCALSIVTYNLHKLGNILLEQERELSKNIQLRKAA
jgi:IS5 family transposase